MVVVDANVLLYAYSADSEHHEASRRWLEAAFERVEEIAFPWMVLLAFVRIATLPKAMVTPLTMGQASSVVNALLARDNAVIPMPSRRHWQMLSELLEESQSKGNLVNDAHLAALAIENGAALCSFDRDFRRFPNLRLITPDPRPDLRPDATVLKR